jgi:hypothetical protein
MRRRSFLQLAAGAAASTLVQHASPAFASRVSLRFASINHDSVPAIVVLPATVPVTEYEESLGVSGWMDSDDVIHVMLEKRHRMSYPEIDFPSLQPGRRYRMRLMNATDSAVPVHLPGRQVELARAEQAPVAGLLTSAFWLKRYSVVEADLVV